MFLSCHGNTLQILPHLEEDYMRELCSFILLVFSRCTNVWQSVLLFFFSWKAWHRLNCGHTEMLILLTASGGMTNPPRSRWLLQEDVEPCTSVGYCYSSVTLGLASARGISPWWSSVPEDVTRGPLDCRTLSGSYVQTSCPKSCLNSCLPLCPSCLLDSSLKQQPWLKYHSWKCIIFIPLPSCEGSHVWKKDKGWFRAMFVSGQMCGEKKILKILGKVSACVCLVLCQVSSWDCI